MTLCDIRVVDGKNLTRKCTFVVIIILIIVIITAIFVANIMVIIFGIRLVVFIITSYRPPKVSSSSAVLAIIASSCRQVRKNTGEVGEASIDSCNILGAGTYGMRRRKSSAIKNVIPCQYIFLDPVVSKCLTAKIDCSECCVLLC